MKIGRIILIEVLIIVILGLLGLGGYYIYNQGQNYVSTDDAQLQAHLVTVVATAPGQIAGSLPAVGTSVQAGDQMFDEKVVSAASAHPAAGAGAAAGPTATTVAVPAPASGQVAQVSVVLGQIVQPGTPLGTIVNADKNTVVAYVPETQVHSVRTGQAVDVTIDAYPSDQFPGHVSAIVPATQSALSLLPSTQSSGNFTKVVQRVPVLIQFENPDNAALYMGLSVEVRIHVNGS